MLAYLLPHVHSTLNILEFFIALWLPFGIMAFLVAFPLWAVGTRSSLFLGLFDLQLASGWPLRQFWVTLVAFALGSTAACTARLTFLHGPARMGIVLPHLPAQLRFIRMDFLPLTPAQRVCVLLPAVLACVMAGFAVLVSWWQGCGIARQLAGVAAGLAAGVASVVAIMHWLNGALAPGASSLLASLAHQFQKLGPGYAGDASLEHAAAVGAMLVSLLFYAALGAWGHFNLGKPLMLPALASPLFALMVLCWAGAGAQFFLCLYHVPLVLLLAVWAVVNTWLPGADHSYPMSCMRSATPAPCPEAVLTAHGDSCAVVAACAGGGIQAAAWAALVLQGLSSDLGSKFDRSLRLLSGISGGSMGAASYVNWLAGAKLGRPPFDVAKESSLDEVAWGLSWPDLFRFFFPLFSIGLADRAYALERAWRGNASADPTLAEGAAGTYSNFHRPLSSWNAPAAARDGLPAIIMNSTMVETGAPLMLGTSDVTGDVTRASRGWMDGDKLHVMGRTKRDISIVRAARLSATFPYVTPVARPRKANRQPHMIDGGLFDDYGTATLTEWLDQALEAQSAHPHPGPVTRVMVLQINGFPGATFQPPRRSRAGWFFQAIAPLSVLVNVRTALQVSHRDVELKMLCDKWKARGVTIVPVPFECDCKDLPLSWHLMPKQIAALKAEWAKPRIAAARTQVAQFIGACPAQPPLPDKVAVAN